MTARSFFLGIDGIDEFIHPTNFFCLNCLEYFIGQIETEILSSQ